MSIEKQTIEKLREAYEIMKDAALHLQNHYGHLDRKEIQDRNCPEFIRADKLRKQADTIFFIAISTYRKSQC